MESTSLDQAVNSLLSPAPEDTGGDNLSEAVDQITETEDDDQSEAIEATAESEDDAELEASSEQDDDEEYDLDDVEIDDEDPQEATEEDVLYSVKADGKIEQATLEQLKQSYAGQAAINKRFQEAAEERKQVEQAQVKIKAHFDQKEAALQQREAQLMQLHQSFEAGGLQRPIEPSEQLLNDDPIGYMTEKALYDKKVQEYNQNQTQLQNIAMQKQQAKLAAEQEYDLEQARLLQQYIPEIADPVKGQQIKDALVNVGVSYGYTVEEMQSVKDARAVRLTNDARKWQELVAKKKSAKASGKKPSPVVKAGAKKRQEGNSATRKKAQQRLQKTGSIDDALNLIIGDS